MGSALSLHFAGAFLSYVLQVGVAYVACLLLERLLRKPQQRFFLWMVFLASAGTYWLQMIVWEIRQLTSHVASEVPADSSPGLTHVFLVPQSWSHSILLAGQIIAVAYVATLVMLAGQVAWRHLQLRRMLRRAIEPSQGLTALFEETSRPFRWSRSRLLVLPGLGSPATACWWKPRILLPEVCEHLGPTPQVADVLYHELVHVSRRDYLWSNVSDWICRLLFFHPAAWQARKQLRLQGELACDMAVIEARPGQRAQYADSLAYFVRLRMLEEGATLGVDFAASASTLGTRIRNILAAPQPQPWWKRILQAVSAMTVVVALSVVSPALTVLLDFTHSAPIASTGDLSTQTHTALAQHHHNPHRASKPNPAAAEQQQQQAQQGQDSLTKLRVRPPLRETPVYRLTSTSSVRPDAEPNEYKAGWSEPTPTMRTVSGTVLAAARQISIGRVPKGHERDRDVR